MCESNKKLLFPLGCRSRPRLSEGRVLARSSSLPPFLPRRRRTPLCDACRAGNVRKVRHLLTHHSARGERRNALEPLQHAIQLCHTNCRAATKLINALCEAGALSGSFQQHPAIWAVQTQICAKAFNALIVALRRNDKWTDGLATDLAWLSTRGCQPKYISLVTQNERNVTSRIHARFGEDLLHAALNGEQIVESARVQTVRLLLRLGLCNIRARDRYGRTALSIAQLRGFSLVESELRAAGVSSRSYGSVLLRRARSVRATSLQACAGNGECSICLEWMEHAVQTECGHAFHEECIRKWLGRKQGCPTCRQLVM